MKKIGLLLIVIISIISLSAFTACSSASGDNDDNPDSRDNTVRYILTVTGGTGGGTFDAGTQVTVTATVPNGKEFVAWLEGETQVSTVNPYTFTLSKNTTLTAVFKDAEATIPENDFESYDFSEVEFGESEPLNQTVSSLMTTAKAELFNETTTNWRRQNLDYDSSAPAMKIKSGSGDATKFSAIYGDNSAAYYGKSSIDGSFYSLSQGTTGELGVYAIYDTSADYLSAVKSTVDFVFDLENSAFVFGTTFKKGVFEGKDLYVITGDFSYDYGTDLGGGRRAFVKTYNIYILDGKVVMANETTDWFADDDFNGTPTLTWYNEACIEWGYTGGAKMPTAWESKVSAEAGKSYAKAIAVTLDGSESSCTYNGAPVWFKASLVGNVAYTFTITVYEPSGNAVSTACSGITAGRYSYVTSTDGSFTSNGAILTDTMQYSWGFTGYLKITLSGVNDAVIRISFEPVI